MDTSNEENTQTFDSLKRLKTYDENKDYISDLPDPIVVHIFSFLPLKDAINTVLIRRFGNLWRSIANLDINYCQFHECDLDDFDFDEHYEKFTSIISQLLEELHDIAALDRLRLKFYFSWESSPHLLDDHLEKDTIEQIEKLISYAISRKVKILDLSFKCCSVVDHSEHYVLPDVFTSRYLTELRLTACNLKLCKNIDLKLLKVLFLHELSVCDDVMENLLIGCPFLEDLCVADCVGLERLSCKNPNLKKVRVSTEENRLLVVSCPFALSLEIGGWLERISLLDVSSVVDASINFSSFFTCKRRRYPNVNRLLRKVCDSKTLRLCTWSILVLSIWSLTNVPCPKFFCKNYILEIDPTKWHFLGLALLFESAPYIETLTYVVLDPQWMFTNYQPKWIRSYDFDGDTYWDSKEANFPNLETIVVYGYRKDSCMIKLVKVLLKSAPRLQKMLIITKKSLNSNGESEFTLEEVVDLSRKLLRLPRASLQATICVS